MFTYLLAVVPIPIILKYAVHAGAPWIFVTATLAIVPCAEWIRRATEHLARSAGSAIGGLVNVTLGNSSELILALFVLGAGHGDVVKGQITGALIGNSLFGLGLAVVVGTWGRTHQTFDRASAGRLSTLLILSVIALLLPAFFDFAERGASAADPGAVEERLSLVVSVVLILVYLANLAYTLITHRDTFAAEDEDDDEESSWPVWRSVMVLLAATAATAFEAELLASALETTAGAAGISTFFLGVVVLALVGNAAEYVAAVYFARRDRMNLVMAITVGSTIQIALLIAPLLVIVSWLMGNPIDLVFDNPLELMAIAGSALIVNQIAHDGETTWFEGVLLLAVYVLLATAFYLVTPT
jgi:Ca2+:H+ antiporter